MFEIDLEELEKSELYQLGEQKGFKKGFKKGFINSIIALATEKFNLDKHQKTRLKKALKDLTEEQLTKIIISALTIESYNEFLHTIETFTG